MAHLQRLSWRFLVLILASCNSERPPDGGGGIGGSGSGGGGGAADAAVAADANEKITGSLCQVVDLRLPNSCSAAELEGIDVRLKGDSAVVLSDEEGGFIFDNPGTESITLVVARNSPAFRTTTLPVQTNAEILVPMVPTLAWEDLLVALGTAESLGTGTVAVYLRSGATPLAGAQLVADTGPIFYDDGSANQWTPDGLTGSAGAALLFGSPEGTVSFTVVGPGSSGTSDVIDVPVVETSTTFVVIDLD